MPQDGWISIHRQIRENWVWDDKPFDKTHAWIDLLLNANHQDNKINLGTELILVPRGSFITSELKLMDRWGWSKTKLRSFLKLLQEDNMIIKISDKKKTTVTIVNYNVYQESENQEKTSEKLQENHKKTIEKLKKDTNNNVNNVNNGIIKEKDIETIDESIKKIHYADNVTMIEEEYSKLIIEYGEPLIKEKIIDLDLWKGSKGKKTKSDYLTIKSWIRKDQKGGNNKNEPGSNYKSNTKAGEGKWAGFKPKPIDTTGIDMSDPDIM